MKMQRSILIVYVCTLMVCTPLFAQDIIVTTDAQKIEAKILEVSKSEIKYKKASNPDGPTFVLSTSEINTVIYSNGEVELYNKQQTVAARAEVSVEPEREPKVEETPTPSTPSVDEKTVEILTLSGSTITAQITELKSNYIAYNVDGKAFTMPASQIQTVTFLKNGQVKEYNGKYSPSIEETKTPLPNTVTKQSRTLEVETEQNFHTGLAVYFEALGYAGSRRMSAGGYTMDGITSGGFGFSGICGSRFNKYVFTGVGLGLNTMFSSISGISIFEMGSPLFVDFRAYMPTSNEQVFPFFELSVGPMVDYLKVASGSGYFGYSKKASVLAFFQANVGVDINHFTMGLGYELWANSTIMDHLFCFKIGGRI